jgi:hypothetical protein
MLGWNFRWLSSRSSCPHWSRLNSHHFSTRSGPLSTTASPLPVSRIVVTLIRVYLLSLVSWFSRHFGKKKKKKNWCIGYLWALQHALFFSHLWSARVLANSFLLFNDGGSFHHPLTLRARPLDFLWRLPKWPMVNIFWIFTRLSICFCIWFGKLLNTSVITVHPVDGNETK